MFELDVLNAVFFQRFFINILSLLLLIGFGFSKKVSFTDSNFTYYMFGIGVFIVTYSMQKIEISLGFAFGLFAIFSMLRYRTEVLTFKEMTCLFLVIVVSLLCAVSPLSNVELIISASLIAGAAYILESPIMKQKLKEQTILYENIENIKPENYSLLVEDLLQKTGLDIQDVIVTSVDFVKDCAKLRIVYVPVDMADDVADDVDKSSKK